MSIKRLFFFWKRYLWFLLWHEDFPLLINHPSKQVYPTIQSSITQNIPLYQANLKQTLCKLESLLFHEPRLNKAIERASYFKKLFRLRKWTAIYVNASISIYSSSVKRINNGDHCFLDMAKPSGNGRDVYSKVTIDKCVYDQWSCPRWTQKNRFAIVWGWQETRRHRFSCISVTHGGFTVWKKTYDGKISMMKVKKVSSTSTSE